MSIDGLITALSQCARLSDAAQAIAVACRDLSTATALAVRTFDAREQRQVQWMSLAGVLRGDVDTRRLAIDRDAFRRAAVNDVWRVVDSIVETMVWESPFVDAAFGFSIPLVSAGELCGTLEVGYRQAPGSEVVAHESLALSPIAQLIAMAARNERLRRHLTSLRDYQAQLIDNANAFVLGIERGWRIHVANKALLNALGVSRSNMIGRDLRDLIPGENRARLIEILAKTLSGTAHVGVPVTFYLKDSVRLETVWNCAPVAYEGTEVRSVVAIGQDVSQLTVLKERMVRSERLATVGQLTSGVVHELNNPLTSISVYTTYLMQVATEGKALGAADIDKLQRIEESAQRILRLSRDLVDYSRPLSTEAEPVDVVAVVAKALTFCDHELQGGAVDMTWDGSGPLFARCVADQIERVVVNLVTNAVHAMKREGQLLVRVFSRQGEIGILVADSGPGIAEDDKPHLFEPFFTTKLDGEGTGLGLSIVKNIVDAHGGRIDVRDSDLGGAAFVVWLPGIARE